MTCGQWVVLMHRLRMVLRGVLEGVMWCTYTRVDEELTLGDQSIGRGKLLTVYGGAPDLIEVQVVRFSDGRLASYTPRTRAFLWLPDTIDVEGVIRWIAEQCSIGMTAEALQEWEAVLKAA